MTNLVTVFGVWITIGTLMLGINLKSDGSPTIKRSSFYLMVVAIALSGWCAILITLKGIK